MKVLLGAISYSLVMIFPPLVVLVLWLLHASQERHWSVWDYLLVVFAVFVGIWSGANAVWFGWTESELARTEQLVRDATQTGGYVLRRHEHN